MNGLDLLEAINDIDDESVTRFRVIKNLESLIIDILIEFTIIDVFHCLETVLTIQNLLLDSLGIFKKFVRDVSLLVWIITMENDAAVITTNYSFNFCHKFASSQLVYYASYNKNGMVVRRID